MAAALLAAPLAGADVEWAVDADGFWHVVGNWSSDPNLPGPSDNVTIDRPGFDLTITHSQGSDTIARLLCSEDLVLSGGSLTVTGPSQVDGALTADIGASLTADGGGATFTANAATTLNGCNLHALGGGSVALPHAGSYTHSGTSALSNAQLTAAGGGSVLDLSALTALAGSTGASSELSVQATGGGRVDLSGIAGFTTGTAVILADGPSSVVDLSGMTSFTPSNTFGCTSSIEARSGGTVLTGSLTTLDAVNLKMDGTGTMATAQIVTYTNGTATLSGAAPDFAAMTNVVGSRFDVTGVALDLGGVTDLSYVTVSLQGGATADLTAAATLDGASLLVGGGVTLALPSAASYVDARTETWSDAQLQADGAGSVLDLASLATLAASTGDFSSLTVQAADGGKVDLSGVASFTTGTANVIANGSGSLVDLSGMTRFTPSNTFGRTSSIEARNGGTVKLTPLAVIVASADVTVATGGTIAVGSLTLEAEATVSDTGSTLAIDRELGVGHLATGVLRQSGGTVEAGGLSLGAGLGSNGTYELTGGELFVSGAYDFIVGGMGPGAFTQTGGTLLLRADRLYIGPVTDGGTGTVQLAGGTILLTGAGPPPAPPSTIGGTLAGHGSIVSAGPIDLRAGGRIAAMGAILTLDADVTGEGDANVAEHAMLRLRGELSGSVVNHGVLASYLGDLVLSGETVTNTGTLMNTANTTLRVSPSVLDHTGSVTVNGNASAGVTFDVPIVNHAGKQIALNGGVLTAPHVTNAAGASITGTGRIAGDLTSGGTAEFFGPVLRIDGALDNEPNGLLSVSSGSLTVGGHTTNDGTIDIADGEGHFQGGLTSGGRMEIDSALAVVGGDLDVGPAGVIVASADDRLELLGGFANRSTRGGEFDLASATVALAGAAVQELEVAGADLGPDPNGWTDNFAFGVLRIETGTRVRLTDVADNQLDGPGGEAQYVDELVFQPVAGIELNDLHLYYRNGAAAKELFIGDADLDGDVDFFDYLTAKGNFNTLSGASWSDGDTNGDGDVDFFDYLATKGNFGLVTAGGPAPPAAGAIPEPTTLLLLGVGACWALRRRRPSAHPQRRS